MNTETKKEILELLEAIDGYAADSRACYEIAGGQAFDYEAERLRRAGKAFGLK